MAIGTVTRYNGFPGNIHQTAKPDWDSPTAGAFMWVLATASYAPSLTHSTAADLGANVITTGDGSPINILNRTVAINAGVECMRSDPANFGSAVTITAKYLICVLPVTAGTYATTSELCFYIDLNVGAGLSLSTTGTSFLINQDTSPQIGWCTIP